MAPPWRNTSRVCAKPFFLLVCHSYHFWLFFDLFDLLFYPSCRRTESSHTLLVLLESIERNDVRIYRLWMVHLIGWWILDRDWRYCDEILVALLVLLDGYTFLE